MMTRAELLDLAAAMSKRELEIMQQKNQDYSGATNGDPFANFRASEILGISPKKGIMLRVMDKIQRIMSFLERGKLAVVGEPVTDAIADIRNYMVLLAGMIEEDRATITYKDVPRVGAIESNSDVWLGVNQREPTPVYCDVAMSEADRARIAKSLQHIRETLDPVCGPMLEGPQG